MLNSMLLHEIFLSLVILSAALMSVFLVFSMYFLLKKQ